MKVTRSAVFLAVSAACFIVGALVFAAILKGHPDSIAWAWGFGGAAAFVIAQIP